MGRVSAATHVSKTSRQVAIDVAAEAGIILGINSSPWDVQLVGTPGMNR